MMDSKLITDFSDKVFDDNPSQIGNSFLLGSAYDHLSANKINIPEGFAITPAAFAYYLSEGGIKTKLVELLGNLDKQKFTNLNKIGKSIRVLLLESDLPPRMQAQILVAKSGIAHSVKAALRLTVKCIIGNNSAADGERNKMHELFFNISSEADLYKAILKSYAALFTDAEIQFREMGEISHFDLDIYLLVQKLVRCDLGCSGISYRNSDGNENRENLFINGCWGMPGNILYGSSDPDLYEISKAHENGKGPTIISKYIGAKKQTLIYFEWESHSVEPVFINIATSETKKGKPSLTDTEIMKLASWHWIAEDYFSKKLRLLWAKDGLTDLFYLIRVIQAL